MSDRPGSTRVTRRARAFVNERLSEARGLGTALADLIEDPESFVAVLRDGLQRLSDPASETEREHAAGGQGAVIGVPAALVHAVSRQLRAPLAGSSAASALWLAQRLVQDEHREIRLFATLPLARSLPDDPERSWQVLRRLGRRASGPSSVDAIADLVARGILLEPFRWAELEQLVYSQSPWERRLVGSTIARMPYQVPASRRRRLDSERALTLVRSLMGDADANVQKALSWALREWTHADLDAVQGLLYDEAAVAVEHDDGHRAWVIRDALGRQPGAVAADLRRRLGGVRRRPGAPSTSTASAISAGFLAAVRLADRAVGQQGERMERVVR